MRLLQFYKVDAANELLRQVGVDEALGPFLGAHLTEVLRKQHPDVQIETLELLQTHPCSAGGQMQEQSTLADLHSLRLPFDVRVHVVSGELREELDLHVVLMATAVDGGYQITSDVFVQRPASDEA